MFLNLILSQNMEIFLKNIKLNQTLFQGSLISFYYNKMHLDYRREYLKKIQIF